MDRSYLFAILDDRQDPRVRGITIPEVMKLLGISEHTATLIARGPLQDAELPLSEVVPANLLSSLFSAVQLQEDALNRSGFNDASSTETITDDPALYHAFPVITPSTITGPFSVKLPDPLSIKDAYELDPELFPTSGCACAHAPRLIHLSRSIQILKFLMSDFLWWLTFLRAQNLYEDMKDFSRSRTEVW